MPGKPTEQEDEYFARLEFERPRKVLDERDARAAEDERRHTLSVVRDAGLFGSVRRIFR